MTQISTNFTRDENRCNCGECTQFGADIKLCERLETIRAWARHNHNPAAIVVIHSWFRCRAHNNRSVKKKNKLGVYGAGSNDSSWHLTGAGADFSIPGVSPEAICWFIRDTWPDDGGVGLYEWGAHLDMRDEPANWDERKDDSTAHS